MLNGIWRICGIALNCGVYLNQRVIDDFDRVRLDHFGVLEEIAYLESGGRERNGGG